MKKLFFIFISILLAIPVYADKLLKDGFLDNKMNYAVNQNIDDPKNKIVLIYNHGQATHDAPSKNCVWKNGIRNFSSLVGEEINKKKIMVYLLCTNSLAGDDYKRLWNKKKFKAPYKGITKLDKRVNSNLKLIDSFLEKGVPKNQIIITGHSCGGWLTMMLIAKYPDKVGGGISLMQACYGKLSKNFKVKKIGTEKALEKFRKKDGIGPADLRIKQISEIKKSKNLPVLVFTHPKDHYDGLLSDWVEEIPGVKRVIISQDRKINGKRCNRVGVNDGQEWKEPLEQYHRIDMNDCFQHYNSTILKFIESRIK